jgi:hypothetical protein
MMKEFFLTVLYTLPEMKNNILPDLYRILTQSIQKQMQEALTAFLKNMKPLENQQLFCLIVFPHFFRQDELRHRKFQ